MSNGEVCALRLDDGSLLTGDYYVAAMPFDRLLKILPESLAEIETFANIARLNVSPITSVHVWLDRSVMKEPFLASIDQTIQWVFNKTDLNGSGSAGQYLQLVISASRALAQQSQQEIITMCRKELVDLIPGSDGAKWIRAIVIRENAATFSPAPGSDRWRPAARTPIHNFFLAGDWTQTGWPATMEGAVRSGYGAAEAILASQGRQIHLVRPELPVSPLPSLLKVTRRN